MSGNVKQSPNKLLRSLTWHCTMQSATSHTIYRYQQTKTLKINEKISYNINLKYSC